MAKFRRSIFLINKPFQLRFALYVCSWLIALSFVYPLIVYSLFDYFVRYASADPHGPPVQILLDIRHQILWLLILLQIVFLGVTFLISIFMSHRIAGPLYKLTVYFNAMREGSLKDELFFREKDYFQELAGRFNEMARSVRERQESAASEIERALQAASPEARASLEKALANLRPQPQ